MVMIINNMMEMMINNSDNPHTGFGTGTDMGLLLLLLVINSLILELGTAVQIRAVPSSVLQKFPMKTTD